jgi:uncharacterized MAPEG superfamily protein
MTIANWCVLIGIFLPYVWFGVANAKGGRERSNHYPRDFANKAEGVAKRAWGAHLNAFEALPAFAAAVIIAQMTHGAQDRINLVAMLWVALRLLHGLFYVADKSLLRSGAWFGGLACVVALFVLAA